MDTAVDRKSLRRVVALANGKGGVGKTSTATHVGALAAAAGIRTLIVDLDPQANAGSDLGYLAAGLSDDGEGLLQAVMSKTLLPTVIKDVRPNLDVIAGGQGITDLSNVLTGRIQREPGAILSLARCLSRVAGDYELVLLDCPPLLENVQDAALAAAKWLLIPTRTDGASRDGLDKVAHRFISAREVNPDLELLGVFLFASSTSAKNVHKLAKAKINDALQGAAPVFDTIIRYAESTAVATRERGQLAHELEREVLAQEPWYQAIRSGEVPKPRLAESAKTLAADYQNLTHEVMTQLAVMEQEVAV